MRICRVAVNGKVRLAVEAGGECFWLRHTALSTVFDILETQPEEGHRLLADALNQRPFASWDALEAGTVLTARLAVPLDDQEVWASGVTYERSMHAREDESHGSGIYDRVYAAPRPELFFKAGATRVVGPNDVLYIRSDATWSVPEPELALVVGPRGWIAGYTIGNDISSRDIEGENPLYLPQAKVHARCCGLGPAIMLADEAIDPRALSIELIIHRNGAPVFQGNTNTSRLHRSFEELVRYLFRDNLFPNGVFLLTGTGIVPEDSFSLQPGDHVAITIAGIGTLRHRIERGPGDHAAI
ncbi:MAG: fumarylacetoacetate hydrolase family protein [Chloroflexi bacterium]|nr:fumarylacetoacetate hydrolase family protein [Chloroflexota bacterium]